MIDSFRFENFWLNEFYNRPVYYDDTWFETNHVALCYAKSKDRSSFAKGVFSHCDNIHADINLHKFGLREDWDEIKYDVMKEITAMRFVLYPDLAEKLIQTKGQDLIDGNNVDEHYWGMCNGVGENNYGKILMDIRDALIKQSEGNNDD